MPTNEGYREQKKPFFTPLSLQQLRLNIWAIRVESNEFPVILCLRRFFFAGNGSTVVFCFTSCKKICLFFWRGLKTHDIATQIGDICRQLTRIETF